MFGHSLFIMFDVYNFSSKQISDTRSHVNFFNAENLPIYSTNGKYDPVLGRN